MRQMRNRPRIGVDLRALVPRPTGIGVYTEALLGELLNGEEFELVGLSHAPLHESVRLGGRDLEIEIHGAPLGVIWQQHYLPRRLAQGDIDAVIGARKPELLGRHPHIARLFPNYRALERELYETRKIFPIMHLLAVEILFARHQRAGTGPVAQLLRHNHAAGMQLPVL